MTKVTIFSNGYDVSEPHYIHLKTALGRIRDGRSKSTCDTIRSLISQGVQDKRVDKLKLSLPSVLFHGVFSKPIEKEYQSGSKKGEKYISKREDESITEHSGLLVLDFDKCDISAKTKQLKADPYIYSYWISPSGTGVKALVKCPPKLEHHYEYYESILERYPELDSTSKSISRLCFESYDPDLYVNPNSKIWDKRITEEKRKEVKAEQTRRRNYRAFDVAVSMVRASYDGIKHDTLIKSAKLLGGYIATGRVDEEEAVKVLLSEVAAKGAKDMAGAEKAIRDGIGYGKNLPLHETKKLEKQQSYTIRDDGTYDFLADKRDMDDYEDAFLNGTLEMGLTSGFSMLDSHWLFKKNTLVWSAGIDNSGKSVFMWYLSVVAAMYHGWKSVIHSAENTDGQVRKKLKEFYLGKVLKNATHEELKQAQRFFDKHFRIMTSKKMHSCEELLMNAEIIYDEGFSFDVLLIDPFNALSFSASTDSYRNDINSLNQLRLFKENYSTVWVVDHIGTQAARNREDGKVVTPRKSDVSGGQIKSNKADDFLILHRDTQGTEWMYVQVNVEKIKDTETGGLPTQRACPIMIQMNKDKCGYTCGFDDPVKQYWERNSLDVPQERINFD